MYSNRQNQGYGGYNSGNYQRPTSPPPSNQYGGGDNRYHTQNHYNNNNSNNNRYDEDYDVYQSQQGQQRYDRPSHTPQNQQQYSNNNYDECYNQHYSRPSGPPPSLKFEHGNTYIGRTSSYNQDGITFQRPSGPPPLPHHGRYQQQGGTKKALLIGINYIGSNNQLRGCINDVENMHQFLLSHGYPADNIVVLTDDQKEQVKIPNRANMLRAMQWLVSGAQPGDCLFFHYSGHGGQEEDGDSDEFEGKDDCIYPVDFKKAGSIIDDDMHDILVKPLVKGVRLTCIFDACHSGSALDLPFAYRAQDGDIKEYNIWKESKDDAMNVANAYASDNIGAMISSATNVFKRFQASVSVDKEKIIEQNSSPADVVMFSGCKDSQTSADANEAGKFTGALSWAFLKVLNADSTQSYLTILQNIRSVLETKYKQKPQLSTSHKIDPNTRFTL